MTFDMSFNILFNVHSFLFFLSDLSLYGSFLSRRSEESRILFYKDLL